MPRRGGAKQRKPRSHIYQKKKSHLMRASLPCTRPRKLISHHMQDRVAMPRELLPDRRRAARQKHCHALHAAANTLLCETRSNDTTTSGLRLLRIASKSWGERGGRNHSRLIWLPWSSRLPAARNCSVASRGQATRQLWAPRRARHTARRVPTVRRGRR